MLAEAEPELVGIVLNNRRKRILGFCQIFFSKWRVDFDCGIPGRGKMVGVQRLYNLGDFGMPFGYGIRCASLVGQRRITSASSSKKMLKKQ